MGWKTLYRWKTKNFFIGNSKLEEAIPILEKWFDDVHAEKEKEQNQPEQSSSENVINDATPENLEKTTAEVIPNETNLSKPQETIVKENLTEKIIFTKNHENVGGGVASRIT